MEDKDMTKEQEELKKIVVADYGDFERNGI